jgi:Ca2+:H+ antiporter
MWINLLLLFVPLSLALGYLFDAGPIWTFFTAIIAIVPLAEWIRRATEQMAHITSPAVGGLLNVTFGNVAELILALFVLMDGHTQVVKAQITGSIIGNGLLGLGLAIVVGSIGRRQQRFNREHAGLLSSLLIISVIGLLLPAIFDYTESGLVAPQEVTRLDENLSLAVSGVLLVVYVANLIYTLVTHRDVYRTAEADAQPGGSQSPTARQEDAPEEGAQWSLRTALGVLLAGTAVLAVEAELVSQALESTASQLGLSTFFLGITVLAVVGNAAEYVSAIYFARKDQMGMVLRITLGASIQVALLIAPLLVIVSYFMGQPMDLVFSSPLELIAVAGVAFTVNAISQDGETDWFEGVLLLAVYGILVFAFFFATPPAG